MKKKLQEKKISHEREYLGITVGGLTGLLFGGIAIALFWAIIGGLAGRNWEKAKVQKWSIKRKILVGVMLGFLWFLFGGLSLIYWLV